MAVADDVLARAARWVEDAPVALATVVGTTGSAPRPVGSAMVVSSDGEVAGSVSGGCVEAAVFDLAETTLASGQPCLRSFGVATDDVVAVGLTCGGRIEVLVQRLDHVDDLQELQQRVAEGRPVALVTVVEHPDAAVVGARVVVDRAGTTDPGPARRLTPSLHATLVDRASALLSAGESGDVTCGSDGSLLAQGVRAFVQVWAPRPRLIVYGAVDFAGALAGVGRFLGDQVTVCDARPTFTTAARFPDAHEVVVDWPHRHLRAEAEAGRIDARTAVCVLTHDARFDVPVLQAALSLPHVGYVGAMGSRRTHRERLQRLRDVGVTDAQLARLRSPLGLDLGARTPEETALSIAAEIVADRRGGSGGRLGDSSGPIHATRSDVASTTFHDAVL